MHESLGLQVNRLDSKGRHSHATVVVNGNLLLVVGGFRGTVLGDIWSYQVLPSISTSTNDPLYGKSICSNYSHHEGCTADPECSWCPIPPHSGCVSRTITCQNQQLSLCSDVCSDLMDCYSCVVHSKNITQPSYPSSREYVSCGWCIHDGTCQPLSELSGSCQVSSANTDSWWKGETTLALNQSMCAGIENKPSGVRYAIYDGDDSALPDRVSSTKTANINLGTESSSYSTARFYFHPYNLTSSEFTLNLRLRGVKANASLIYQGDQISLATVETSGSEDLSLGVFPPSPLPLRKGRHYLIIVEAWRLSSDPMYQFMWSAVTSSLQTIPADHLEPYSSGECSLYQDCLSCQLDLSCGWCPITTLCVSRSDESLSAAECGTDDPERWLIIEPEQCDVCSIHIDCQECAATGVCEWLSDKIVCQRRGIAYNSTVALDDPANCPSKCVERSTCSECLAYNDECILCGSTQTCDQFSPYLLTNSFGQCEEWKESHAQPGTCDSCEHMTTCSDCLEISECGWCSNDFNPNVGICTKGDYSTSRDCSAVLHASINVSQELLTLNLSLAVVNESNVVELSANASFSYAVCPDVDECMLQIDSCLGNSSCLNNAESYECPCDRGFEGDGTVFCNKTCFYECVYGACSGPPLYQCDCDLGWTNISCDTDCGCYNHSTCVNGTGICDLCQDFTWGNSCEFCLPKSYGDATVFPGCLACDCNGHGVDSMDFCNITDGVCFCQDGFEGDNCELCGATSVGDPRNGNLCYEYSYHRLVILNATGRHGVTSSGRYHDVSYTRWVITPFSDLDTVSSQDHPLMTITVDSINTTCPMGFLYVYDGINSDDSHGITAAYCGSTGDPFVSDSVDIYSGYATLVYYGNSTDDQVFTASYTVHQCNGSCYGNRSCDSHGNCVCKEGFEGINCEQVLCSTNCSSHGHCNEASQQCFCDEGFSGADCSEQSFITVNRLLDGILVQESPDPRVGFTVVDCGPEGSVLFGGLSTQQGFMKDLWRFDGVSWHFIAPADGVTPSARHRHAAECLVDRQTAKLLVYGGVVVTGANHLNTSSEIWSFDFGSLRWSKLPVEAIDLAGHTLTAVGEQRLVIAGGYSLLTDWNNETFELDLVTNTFGKGLVTTGAAPAGLMMHTAVYHAASNALYIHGGYRYYIDNQQATNETFFYDISNQRWHKRPDDYISHTARRYDHAAVQLNDSLLIIGGVVSQQHYEPSLSLYSYDCDRWHDLGSLSPSVGANSAVLNSSASSIYIFSSTQTSFSVDTLSLPDDICSLYSGSDAAACLSQRGCHACNQSGDYVCFSGKHLPPAPCRGDNADQNLITNEESCDLSIVTERDCNAHKDCVQCLTSWLYHETGEQVTQKCKWCSYCDTGKCISKEQICEDENPCKRAQSEKHSAEMCVEQSCRSARCDQCEVELPEDQGCIWTRNFKRSGEVSRQVNPVPFNNWNCVTSRLIALSRITVWSAPPSACPVPCQMHTTCSACLSSDGGGAGGFAACYWSSTLNMCLTPATLPLVCETGICAPLIQSGDSSQCPLPCSAHNQCAHCLAQPHCGWCSEGDESLGSGRCMEGNHTDPYGDTCGSLSFIGNETTNETLIDYTWHFFSCPLENECNTSHHDCHEEREYCVDLELGHYCICKEGYKSIDGDCIPQCDPECVHGECIKPQVCDCDFSYVGDDCSTLCQCNMHSECAGPNATDTCLNCIDNTVGEQCQWCDILYVGDASAGGVCESCKIVCNQHAQVCMDNSTLQYLILQPNQTISEAYLQHESNGPSSHKDVVCIDCANNTDGNKCETCLPGFFRRTDDPTVGCTKCQCNGHSSICNQNTGANCECQNNTASPCQNAENCYQEQCNQCKDQYSGSPVGGHQCYLQLISDDTYCITREGNGLPLTTEKNCEDLSLSLPQGQAVMFAIQPRFLNVDIKIYININFGEADIYLSKFDDMFIINWDATNNSHQVSLDPKYNIGTNERRKRDFSTDYRVKRDTSDTYNLVNYIADSSAISNYFELVPMEGFNDSIYQVAGVKGRVVLTLPEREHNLKLDRFYVVVLSKSENTRGIFLFQQDQIRIQLFVFFAVFFSCFFKFLSICVIIWKMKSLYSQQQQRIQRAVELGQMASRPFANLMIHFDEHDEGYEETTPKHMSTEFQVIPASCEYTDDGVAVVGTVVFELPGGRDAPARATFGSALMTFRQNRTQLHKPLLDRHKDATAHKTSQN
ncbi:multiple epidermal growth factor-like domains protein 8 [Watersipora subatra]|uniref:multiple epidermal growth factor-like domains protein 8 n=1 Tax=Watersipora subatra TaxID=2589382 RepID=UPI00355C8833